MVNPDNDSMKQTDIQNQTRTQLKDYLEIQYENKDIVKVFADYICGDFVYHDDTNILLSKPAHGSGAYIFYPQNDMICIGLKTGQLIRIGTTKYMINGLYEHNDTINNELEKCTIIRLPRGTGYRRSVIRDAIRVLECDNYVIIENLSKVKLPASTVLYQPDSKTYMTLLNSTYATLCDS
jgi:hypothetical protein